MTTLQGLDDAMRAVIWQKYFESEGKRRRALLDALALHSRHGDDVCDHCNANYPCTTITTIAEALGVTA